MTGIREVRENELQRWVDATRAALDEADTVEGYLDWKRRATSPAGSTCSTATSSRPAR